ncbi:MAG: hypothetical protein FVQ81_06555 [Candidatus Glassbacteria bacterium]|nr:hypothetical protein [Candidatus Glassbacteria bacterium]
MRTHIITLLAIAVFLQPLAAAQQQNGPRREAPLSGRLEMGRHADAVQEGPFRQRDSDSSKRRLSPGVRLLLGVLVPGLPQFLDGRPRAWAYFAVEGVAVGGLVLLNSRGKSYKNRYVNLARAARGNFVYPGLRNNPTEDVDLMAEGYGEYFEDLLKWQSSGDYDNDPDQPGIQPETDPRTYNGHQWDIAMINNYTGTSGGLPVPLSAAEEQAALDLYLQQVYTRGLNWDWTGLEAENAEYHRLFDRSESSYRSRSNFIAALIANHIVSVLDVLITERLSNSESLRRAGVSLELRMHSPAGAPAGAGQPMLTVGREF